MANKTQKTKVSVFTFLNSISDESKRKDSKQLAKLMEEVTGEKPVMWGESIVGFGDWHYKYASGREGDFFAVGFSPRKDKLTLYIMPGYQDFGDLLEKLGPHKHGKSCLHIKRLSDIHIPTLKKIITKGYKDLKKKYPNP
jgi:hypothetical protein